MKKMKTNWLLLTIGILLLCNNFIQAQTLRIEISLSKDAYVEAEPIWLDVTLTSISQDTARTWGLCLPCLQDFEVIVKDEKGDPLEYTGPHYEVIMGPGWLMKPGESYYYCVNLSEHFGKFP